MLNSNFSWTIVIDYRCCTFVSIHYTIYICGILSQPSMQKRNNQTEILPNYFLFSLRCYSILSYGSKIHCSSAKIWWKIMLHKKYSWICRKYPLFMIKPLCFTMFHPSSIVHITKFHRSPAQGALPQDCEAPALWAARPPLALPNRCIQKWVSEINDCE